MSGVFYLNFNSNFNFNCEFDIYLIELKHQTKGDEDPVFDPSRLTTFKKIEELASRDGYTVRSIELKKLPSRYVRLLSVVPLIW
jgi:hypothetical protein